jgi:cbb3-type cytochrome oxidase subunit 3
VFPRGAPVTAVNSEVSNVAGTIYLLLLVASFIGIVIWIFGRKRKARFETNARIPLNNDKGYDDSVDEPTQLGPPKLTHAHCRPATGPNARLGQAAFPAIAAVQKSRQLELPCADYMREYIKH